MYQQMIRKELARRGRLGVNSRYVEAWMRLEHGCLDGLDPEEFRREVAIGADCVEADPDASVRLAGTYGLS